MRIRAALLVCFLLLWGLILPGCPDPGAGAANPVIAEFTGGDHVTELTWGVFSTGIVYELAQSFQAPANASCGRVELQLGAFNGAPSGDYIVRLETDAAGAPSGTPISVNANASMSAVSLSPHIWNSWRFDVPIPLAAGQTYWIVCRTTEGSGVVNSTSVSSDTTESYPDGTATVAVNHAAWNNAALDLNFRILR